MGVGGSWVRIRVRIGIKIRVRIGLRVRIRIGIWFRLRLRRRGSVEVLLRVEIA